MSENRDRFEYEVVALFDRVREQLGPVPTAPLEQVVARGRQVRRTRRALTGAGVLGLAAAVAVPLVLTAPGGDEVRVVPAQSSTATSVPTGSPSPSSATLAPGMLRASDLGSTGGWTVGTMQGDSGAVSSASWPGCTGPAGTVAGVQVAGTGSSQMYRGQTPEGREWIANETLLHLDAATAQKLAATAQRTAACTSAGSNTTLLAISPQVVVTGLTIKEGPVGMATAVAMSGTTLVSIDTLPGGAALGVGLPGQTQWLVDLVRTAVQRAGAPEPAAPKLTQAAVNAASRDKPSTPDVTTAPTKALPLPSGFLSTADLGADPAWTFQVIDTSALTGATGLSVPQCRGKAVAVTGDDVNGHLVVPAGGQ